jgi:hypothetical protein
MMLKIKAYKFVFLVAGWSAAFLCLAKFKEYDKLKGYSYLTIVSPFILISIISLTVDYYKIIKSKLYGCRTGGHGVRG